MSETSYGIGPHGLRAGNPYDAADLGADLDRLEAVRRQLHALQTALSQAATLSHDHRCDAVLKSLRDGIEDLLSDLTPVLEELDEDYARLA